MKAFRRTLQELAQAVPGQVGHDWMKEKKWYGSPGLPKIVKVVDLRALNSSYIWASYVSTVWKKMHSGHSWRYIVSYHVCQAWPRFKLSSD